LEPGLTDQFRERLDVSDVELFSGTTAAGVRATLDTEEIDQLDPDVAYRLSLYRSADISGRRVDGG
jgi:hypothetical protein